MWYQQWRCATAWLNIKRNIFETCFMVANDVLEGKTTHFTGFHTHTISGSNIPKPPIYSEIVVKRLSPEIYASQITSSHKKNSIYGRLLLWKWATYKNLFSFASYSLLLLPFTSQNVQFAKIITWWPAWTTESRHRKWQRPKLGVERFWNLQWFYYDLLLSIIISYSITYNLIFILCLKPNFL